MGVSSVPRAHEEPVVSRRVTLSANDLRALVELPGRGDPAVEHEVGGRPRDPIRVKKRRRPGNGLGSRPRRGAVEIQIDMLCPGVGQHESNRQQQKRGGKKTRADWAVCQRGKRKHDPILARSRVNVYW